MKGSSGKDAELNTFRACHWMPYAIGTVQLIWIMISGCNILFLQAGATSAATACANAAASASAVAVVCL